MPPHQPHSESKVTDIAMDAATLMLTTLRDAARLTPIPYVQEAAGLALGIITLIQGARDNKDAFQRLADDACCLVYVAILATSTKSEGAQPRISKDLYDNLQELVGTLARIERFARKHGSSNAFISLIRRQSDLGKIQEYRESLRQSLDMFGLQSSMTIQENIGRLSNQQEEIITILKGLKTPDSGRRPGTEQNAVNEESMEHLEEQVEASREEFNPTHHAFTSDSSSHRPKAVTNPFRTQQFMSRNQPNTILRPASVPYPKHSFLGHIQSSHGQFTFTSIGGDQTITNASHHIVNTNSGNVTSTTIMNSNNDSSVRTSE